MFLATTATSVPSEVLFSACGYQVWDRRNKLSPERAEMIVFLYKNYILIKYVFNYFLICDFNNK